MMPLRIAAAAAAVFLTAAASASSADHEIERVLSPVRSEMTAPAEEPASPELEAPAEADGRQNTAAPGLEITVLTASSLPPELTAGLAEEVLRLRPIPVSIVYRGLPVSFRAGDPVSFRHDKTESERRLAPLIERGLGAVIDPGVFRRTEKALKQFDSSLGSLSLPAILFTTSQGTEIVTGTVSVSWAAGYALARTNDPIWRSEAAEALRKAGIAELVEGAR